MLGPTIYIDFLFVSSSCNGVCRPAQHRLSSVSAAAALYRLPSVRMVRLIRITKLRRTQRQSSPSGLPFAISQIDMWNIWDTCETFTLVAAGVSSSLPKTKHLLIFTALENPSSPHLTADLFILWSFVMNDVFEVTLRKRYSWHWVFVF